MAGRLDTRSRPPAAVDRSHLNGSIEPPEQDPVPTSGATSVVASARHLNRQVDRNKARTNRKEVKEEAWQKEAWAFVDSIGELGYIVDETARSASKARLIAARVTPLQGDPIPLKGKDRYEKIAMRLTSRFAGGIAGQSLLIERAAAHLQVAGDSYLVGTVDHPREEHPPTNNGHEPQSVHNHTVDGARLEDLTWRILAPGELTTSGQNWVIDDGHGKRTYPDKHILIIRIWRSHRRHSARAVSPVMRNLPVLRELEGLTKDVSARIDSRLAGAGLLMLPSEMKFPSDPDNPETSGIDKFMEELTEAMMTAIENRDSAEALVPIMLTAPADVLEKVQHIKWAQDLSQVNKQLRDEAIRRVALGMDAPPEILLGQGDINHWSAWSVSESYLKTHIEPLLTLICDGLTVGYLRPALRAMGVPNADEYIVWYDTHDLALRPNRSGEAERAFDRHAISGNAFRRELGFDESDAPSLEDLSVQILLQTARNPSGALEVMPLLLRLMGRDDLAADLEFLGSFLGAINDEVTAQAKAEEEAAESKRGPSTNSDPDDDPRPTDGGSEDAPGAGTDG